jgi:hypothetical protein
VPTGLFGGADPNFTAQAIVLTIEIVALWLLAGTVLLRQWRENHRTEPEPDPDARRFLRLFPVAYLVVFAVLWCAALPDYFAAEDGTTETGAPVGNLPYVVLCFALATTSLVLALRSLRPGPRPASPVRRQESAPREAG